MSKRLALVWQLVSQLGEQRFVRPIIKQLVRRLDRLLQPQVQLLFLSWQPPAQQVWLLTLPASLPSPQPFPELRQVLPRPFRFGLSTVPPFRCKHHHPQERMKK